MADSTEPYVMPPNTEGVRRGIAGFATSIRRHADDIEKLGASQADRIGELEAALKEALDDWERWADDEYEGKRRGPGDPRVHAASADRIAELRRLLP